MDDDQSETENDRESEQCEGSVLDDNQNEKEAASSDESNKSVGFQNFEMCENEDFLNDGDNGSANDSEDEPSKAEKVSITSEQAVRSLKLLIRGKITYIWEKFQIFDLFDLLNTIENSEVALLFKGALHIQFSEYVHSKNFMDHGIEQLDKFRVDFKTKCQYISLFYHHYFHYNYEDVIEKNIDIQDDSQSSIDKKFKCDSKEFNKLSSARKENKIFIQRFIYLFDLFWRCLFSVPVEKLNLKRLNDDRHLKIFYDHNKTKNNSQFMSKCVFGQIHCQVYKHLKYNICAYVFIGTVLQARYVKVKEYRKVWTKNFNFRLDKEKNAKESFKNSSIETSQKKTEQPTMTLIDDFSKYIRTFVSRNEKMERIYAKIIKLIKNATKYKK
ncbi:hypothetical protein EDEG_00884 [Edhazardia aedis USNM 41457]|uniref:Uncharacterized protein n=1 Tax=Edhazardia aedis (strain USNM 41457) TaxID=1003232 RepID=J9DUP6_EDHAE|nr:hypothetical protein EDEG_00884 [Edhazardia aedis USNM 41457]|eukprot:EJW05017.1 hypothetical protein EDEG_00884 [Edhazardia aedis USNM 41457]